MLHQNDPSLHRVLIVDDDDLVRRSLARSMRIHLLPPAEVLQAATVAAALKLIDDKLDLVVTDLALPDGSGVDVALAASQLSPPPSVVAMSGVARASDGFKLARAGAFAFLEKPVTATQILSLVRDKEDRDLPAIAPFIREQLGRRSLHELAEDVRNTLIESAIIVARGNKTVAARMLGINRQTLQKMIRRTRPDQDDA